VQSDPMAFFVDEILDVIKKEKVPKVDDFEEFEEFLDKVYEYLEMNYSS
jgi:hypothetical protein